MVNTLERKTVSLNNSNTKAKIIILELLKLGMHKVDLLDKISTVERESKVTFEAGKVFEAHMKTTHGVRVENLSQNTKLRLVNKH